MVTTGARNAPIYVAMGWILVILSIGLVLPTILSFLCNESTAEDFALSAFLALFFGGLLICAFSSGQAFRLYLGQGFLLTIASWCAVSFFSALPFYFSGMVHSLTDALFEAVSALTTTGISLVEESHYFPHSLRFWRIFLQWIGGFGIVLMAVTLLPALKIGGEQLMLSEFSDRSEKMMPRASKVATLLMGIYALLTAVCALFLKLGRMKAVNALYYSMAAISTGGIITTNEPIDLLSPYCKSILIVAMILGGSTLLLLVAFLSGNRREYVQDEQIRGYYKLLMITILLTVGWRASEDHIITNIFLAVSAMTTTGFAVGVPCDGFLSVLFFLASYIGGCSGSTSGGIKVFRLQIFYRITKNNILSLLNPYGYFPTFYNKLPVDESVVANIVTTVFVYVTGWLAFALGFAGCGHNFSQALSLSAGLVANSGMYFSEQVVFTESSKWLAIVEMLCGRFEFITLVAVLMMPFWRR